VFVGTWGWRRYEESRYQEAFATLGGTRWTKDFPNLRREPPTVERCRTDRSSECRLFLGALRGKERVLSKGRSDALARTLAVVDADCLVPLRPAEPNSEAELSMIHGQYRCSGAFDLLYFFSSPEEDEAIRSFFKARRGLLAHAASRKYEFLRNRPEPLLWRPLFETSLPRRILESEGADPAHWPHLEDWIYMLDEARSTREHQLK
jgi:hypothetical protein